MCGGRVSGKMDSHHQYFKQVQAILLWKKRWQRKLGYSLKDTMELQIMHIYITFKVDVGKGRVAVQLGCCYNYAMDKNVNPPVIIRDEEVDALPSIFIQMIKRMDR